MMNKKLILEKYVKVAVQKLLKEEEQATKNAEKAMFLIHRFPKLKELFADLMSPAFGRFIANIKIIAPKPTTFIVELINGQEFEIAYLGDSKFRLKILGKKYYPANIMELERASQAIADLLTLSKPDPNMEAAKQKEFDAGLANDLGGGGGSFSGGGESFPTGGEPTLPNAGGEQFPVSNEPLTADSEIPPNPEEEEPKLPTQPQI